MSSVDRIESIRSDCLIFRSLNSETFLFNNSGTEATARLLTSFVCKNRRTAVFLLTQRRRWFLVVSRVIILVGEFVTRCIVVVNVIGTLRG